MNRGIFMVLKNPGLMTLICIRIEEMVFNINTLPFHRPHGNGILAAEQAL